MSVQNEIRQVFAAFPTEFSEKKGVVTAEFVVARRKAFLSKKTITYIAKYRIDEASREVRFTEMLKESGSGLSIGGSDSDFGPGFGFKKETYKTGAGGRDGVIEEQSNLFGKRYNYEFDFQSIRKSIEQKAQNAGFDFKYQITPIGL